MSKTMIVYHIRIITLFHTSIFIIHIQWYSSFLFTTIQPLIISLNNRLLLLLCKFQNPSLVKHLIQPAHQILISLFHILTNQMPPAQIPFYSLSRPPNRRRNIKTLQIRQLIGKFNNLSFVWNMLSMPNLMNLSFGFPQRLVVTAFLNYF